MKGHSVHAVIGNVDHPHPQRPRPLQIDPIDSDTEADDGPTVQLLQGPGIESGRRPGEDHIRPGGNCDDFLHRLSRARDQVDVTEHSKFDVEITEPRTENRHLGSP